LDLIEAINSGNGGAERQRERPLVHVVPCITLSWLGAVSHKRCSSMFLHQSKA